MKPMSLLKPLFCFLIISVFSNFLVPLCFAQVSFTPLDTIKDYGEIKKILYEDFDNDGIIDLLFVRPHEILIKKGTGDGNFSLEEKLYHKDNNPILSISNFYDINNDGYLDLAFKTEDLVTILLGSSEGFSLNRELELSTAQDKTILWDDYNMDGNVDLLVEVSYGILINYDWESDIPAFNVLFESYNNYVYDFKVVDINLDQKKDIVLSTINDLGVYLNTPEGFSEILKVNANRKEIILGDISMDGYPDLVYDHSNELYSLIYDPLSNTFTKNNISNNEGNYNIGTPALIDIDNNNSLDIVFRTIYRHLGISYFPNSGGEIQAKIDLISDEVIETPIEILGVDVNGDTKKEIVIHGINNQEVHFLDENNEVASSLYNLLNVTTVDLLYEDMDSDGIEDVIEISPHGKVVIRWGSEKDSFSEYNEYPSISFSKTGLIYDFNSDGINDILLCTSQPNLYVMYGLGNRQFDTPKIWKLTSIPSEPILIDSNNDSEDELLYFQRYANLIRLFHLTNDPSNKYFQTENYITLGKGDGIIKLTANDFNSDGFTDIATLNRLSKNISILMNDGAGAFTESTIDLNMFLSGIQSLDYNFDGYQDLLVAARDESHTEAKLLVYIGNNDGSFELHEVIVLGDLLFYTDINVFDVDGDDDNDIIIDCWKGCSHKLMLNNENSFTLQELNIDTPDRGFTSINADIDGDNKIDFIYSSLGDGGFYIQKNNSVTKSSIEEFSIEAQNLSYNSFDLNFIQTKKSEKLVIISELDNLTKLPLDLQFYESNPQYGLGTELGGGYVVYAGSDENITVSRLMPQTHYHAFVFNFNQNYPQNTIINYSNNFHKTEITTSSSIYLLQDLASIEIDEDSSYKINLDDYIHNIGSNTYTVSTNDQNISLTLNESSLLIKPLENYFGQSKLTISITNDLETVAFEVDILISPINDKPVIAGLKEAVVIKEDTPFILSMSQLDVKDPDDTETEKFSLRILGGENYSLDGTTIIPDHNYFGKIAVPVIVNDGFYDSDPYPIDIEVSPVNDPPIIVGQTETLVFNLYPSTNVDPQQFEIPISNLEIEDPDNDNLDDFVITILEGQGYSVENNSFSFLENKNQQLLITVKVSDGDLQSEAFDIEAESSVVTSILSEKTTQRFKIWPNPASTVLNIMSFDKMNTIINASLIDLSGKPIFIKKSRDSYSFEIDGIPRGAYLLKIVTDFDTSTKSIMIK